MKNILFQYFSQTCRLLHTPLTPARFNVFLVFLFLAFSVASGGEIIKHTGNGAYKIRTVVIDAGHGGHDPGCLGSDSREKHITLAVAKKLAAALQSAHPDLRVILTRDTDVFVPLHERAAIANRNQADIFISIHCNFMPGRASVQGSETYVMGLHTAEHNLAVAKRENASILLEEDYELNYDFDPNSPEGHIALSMYQSAYIEQSILFADFVEKEFAAIGRKSRGVRQAGFVVLKATSMPSALIEIGFLSNKDEEAYLKNDEGQNTVTGAILRAFSQYRASIEGGPAVIPVAYQAPAVVEAPKKQTAPSPAPKTDRRAGVSTPAGGKPEGIPVEAVLNSGGSNGVAVAQPATQPKSSWPEVDAPKIIGGGATTGPAPGAAVVAKGPGPATDGHSFGIQLAVTSSPADLSQTAWRNLGYQVEEIREDGKYKYQVRHISTYAQAKEIKAKVEAAGFPGAFIVAYRDGRRVPVEEALRAEN